MSDQYASRDYLTTTPRRWSVGQCHKFSWIRRRGWRPGSVSYSLGAIFLRIMNMWHQVTDELPQFLRNRAFSLKRWVLGILEFAPGLSSWLRDGVKWCVWWHVECKVMLSSTATPFLLLSSTVLWLPDSPSVINGFAPSSDGAAKAVTPSLRPKPPSLPILHPTGCLAEAGGKMHSVINSIHCWAEG